MISAASQGNILAFTIQIANTAQASRAMREFAAEARKAQRDLNDVYRGRGVMPTSFRSPSGGSSVASRPGSKTPEDRERERTLKQMWQGRERAERERERDEKKEQKESAASARATQRQKEKIELLRVREAAAEDRKAQRERIASEKRATKERERQQRKADAEVERARQQGLSEWRAERSARRGTGSGHGRGGLVADLSRAAIPDHYVRSVFRIEDAVAALTSEGVGRQVAVRARLANRAVNRFGNLASGGLLAAGSLGPFGMGGGTAVAGGLALGAGAIAGGFFSHQALTRGAPPGGVMDNVGQGLLSADTWMRENIWGRSSSGSMFSPGNLSERMIRSKAKIGRLSGYAATGNSANTVASMSAMLNASLGQTGATFGDIGAGFRPQAFDLMGGSTGSLADRLGGLGNRRNLGADLIGVNAQMAINRAGMGKGNKAEDVELEKQMVALTQERQRLLAEMATTTQTQLRITQEEANIAKGRLQTAQTGFGLQDRGTQAHLIRLGNQMNTAMGLQGGARDAVLSRFTPEQLQMLQGVGTERTTRFVQEATRLRASRMGFDPIFGGGELATIGAAGKEGARIDQSARDALKAGGVGNAVGELAKVFVDELRKLEMQNLEMNKKIMGELINQLKAEIFQKSQADANEATKTAQLRRASNQFAV